MSGFWRIDAENFRAGGICQASAGNIKQHVNKVKEIRQKTSDS